MKEIPYKTFSWSAHKKNAGSKRPSVCQFELTFKCGLHCKHCYTDCYNKPAYAQRELNLKQVKAVIDKIYDAGVLWMCFTGGDPLTRKDFLDIYTYAKKKGFIVTLFTNGYSINKKIVKELKNNPPFVIELTFNAATREIYEKISQRKGSFIKVMRGIDLMLSSGLPLKIKTKVTQDNLKDLPKTKGFIKRLGLKFRPSFGLFPRLNGDLTPCDLRLSPEEIFRLNGKKKDIEEAGCPSALDLSQKSGQTLPLFRCAIGGGDSLHVDPYGNTFACNLIREPSFDLLKFGVNEAMIKSLAWVRNRRFHTLSKCKDCPISYACTLCPGKAYLETRDMEAPIEYYCRLTQMFSAKERQR